MSNKQSSPLAEYARKRDFNKTREPEAKLTQRRGPPLFVIQKHDASRLHYDFRLQIDDVLASWAVPKGLSTNPKDKRLAVQTEDHPLEYADFEGVIPQGEYGGGTILVWDRGSYRNLRATKERDKQKRKKTASMSEALTEGLIEVWLDGKKLQGGYTLRRIDGGKSPKWLVSKMSDEKADARRDPVSSQPDSVKSGRSMAKVAEEEGL
jgi:DNA ligase D-like protein (predicted 3'-phosphoesterase)